MDFHFPILVLLPEFDSARVEHPPFAVVKRRWQTSTFDLATLATRHKLHLPYQTMDVLLASCNMEICVHGEDSLETATEAFQALRLMLYTEGVSPFLCPFIATHSINEYSGINSRDSPQLREQLNPGLQHGLTSESGTVEAWPFEMSFACVSNQEGVALSADTVISAAAKVPEWRGLLTTDKRLRSVQRMAITAPTVMPVSQSYLHIWSGLEALFPTVSTEVSFRVSLYLAQLLEAGSARLSMYDRLRNMYKLRSALAHGSREDVTIEEWQIAWRVFVRAIESTLCRGGLPKEKDLIAELLGSR